MQPNDQRAGRPPAGSRHVRDDLLAAALDLLASAGDPRSVSVEAIVARARCRPPALYHYFSSKDALLRSACLRALDEIAAEMNDQAATEADPLDSLRRRALTYFDFAAANPAVYRVLFIGPGTGPASSDDDLEPGQGLQDLVDAVARCLPKHLQDEAFTIAFGVWGTMHGLAALHLSNSTIPTEFIRATLATSVQLAISGARRR